MNQHVMLNELGMISCLGDSPKETLLAVLAGTRQGFVSRTGLRDAPVVVGEVSADLPALESFPDKFASRNNQLVLAALGQIELAVRNTVSRYGADRIGIIVGSSTSGILEGGNAIVTLRENGHFPEHYRYQQQEIGNPSDFLRWYLATSGPAYTVSTACTSSAKALAAAARLIESGICDAVVTGGVDTLCPLTISGFSALESISINGCNPFSVNRDGITIGEGAALFLISREEAPVRLCGWGESLDAYHISAPDPEGIGAEISILAALERAGISSSDINYINLHGTGTVKNDKMEANLVSRLFGNDIPVSSTKGVLGHTLGAAGAIEAGLCWMLMKGEGGHLPPHYWDSCTDPELPALNLCRGDTERRPSGGWNYMLSNSFAFGGSNTVLVFGN